LKTAGDNYLLVRYEDFVRQPQSVIEAIVRYVQEPPSDLSFFVDSHTVRLALSHNPAGNPNKHDQGMIEIRPDLEWQMKMPRFHQYLVTTLTWPLLLKYDYFGKSASG